jgi:hypothetical protein
MAAWPETKTLKPIDNVSLGIGKKKIADKDKIHLLAGLEYTKGNLAETGGKVWGCAK